MTVDGLSPLTFAEAMLVSREIQIGFPCPHLIIEEVVALGADKRSLNTRAAVASANSVRIMVNNEVYVPPAGLYSRDQRP